MVAPVEQTIVVKPHGPGQDAALGRDLQALAAAERRRSSLFKLREEMLRDASKLDEDEFNEASRMFREMDEDNGGALEMNEIDLLFRRLKLWLSVPQIWALVQEVDTDCNGQIELDEFCMMLSKIRGKLPLSLRYYMRQLPRKTREQFEGIFKILDTDKDGCLTKNEMRLGLQRLHVKGQMMKNDAEFDEYFKQIDADGSGQIDLEEFVTLMAKLRKPVPQIDAALLHLTDAEVDRFRQIFNISDVNGGGTLTTHELHALFENLGYSFPLAHTNLMVQEVDIDNTGTIDFEEFLFLLVKLGAGSAMKQRVIMKPGGTYEEGHEMKVPLDQLWDLGYDDISKLREAGWSAQELVEAEMASLLDLRRHGFTASDLRRGGWKARDLKLAGYSMSDLRVAGYSAATLRRCSKEFVSQKIVEEPDVVLDELGQRCQPLMTMPASDESPDGPDEGPGGQGGLLGISIERPHTVDPNLRWWSTPRIRQLCDGPTHDFRRPFTAN